MPFTLSPTHVCLMANLMPSNLTLSLTVYFCAMHGYATTHMHITHVTLYCYGFFTGTLFFTDLLIFLFNLILSFQTLHHKENLYKISLISCLSHFHHICLPHSKPYAIKPNFIFDSSFPCSAWLCCHTHVHYICYTSLLFCHHHVVASYSPILICLS